MRIKHSSIVGFLLILSFAADAANSLLANNGRDSIQISIYVRLLAEAYFLFYLIITKRKTWLWEAGAAFIAIWLIGALVISQSTAGRYDFFESFKDLNKMFFVFICLVTFKEVFQIQNGTRTRLFKLFEWLILIEVASVILGFVFDVDLLASYTRTVKGVTTVARFGYQGLIPAQNEVSAFFLIAFFYFLWKNIYLKSGTLYLLLTTIAGVLTGTKVGALLAGLLVLYLLKRLRLRIRRTHLILLAVLVGICVVAFVQRDYLLSRFEPTINYFTYWVEQRGAVILFTTGRNVKVDQIVLQVLPHFNWINILFGGYNLSRFATEMDIIDVFLKLGAIGTLLFYSLYIGIILRPKQVKINLNRLLFVIVWLSVSTTAGHVVFSAINGAYLAILLLAFETFSHKEEAATPSIELTPALSPLPSVVS